MRIKSTLTLVFLLCLPASAMAQDDFALAAEAAPVTASYAVLPTPALLADSADAGDAARLLRAGGALRLTGGVLGIGGTAALAFGGLSYALSGMCVRPSSSCTNEAEAPVGLLIAGGASLATGLGLFITGTVMRGRGSRMLEEASAPSVQVGVAPSRDGGVVSLSGSF